VCAGGVDIGKVPRITRAAMALFAAQMQAIRGDMHGGRSIGHIVNSVLMMDGGIMRACEAKVSGEDAHSDEERRDAERALEDLRTLASAATDYQDSEGDDASLVGFLEHAALTQSQELDGEDERITISTIHRSKGTEAELVFVLGCEEGLLPSWRTLQDPDPRGLEEERRLFYVAATRAKNRLIFTCVASRNDRVTDGGSRFLAEAGLHGA
jgi:DNA helicase-2/ATP-dependent DNA helicase PcrA